MCERCKTAAFRIGQAQPPAAKLGFEEAILCLQVGNDLLLVTLKSAGEHGEQDLWDHGLSSGVQA